jgi:hypothetical protein
MSDKEIDNMLHCEMQMQLLHGSYAFILMLGQGTVDSFNFDWTECRK